MDANNLPKFKIDLATYDSILKDPLSVMTSLSSSGFLEMIKNSAELTADKRSEERSCRERV